MFFHRLCGRSAFYLIGIRKRYEPGNEECRNSGKQGEDEEILIPQKIAHVSADCSRKHHTQIHDTRSEGIVRHLVLARSYLLHHKQRKPHKAEAVTEILQHDGTANQHAALRLIYR